MDGREVSRRSGRGRLRRAASSDIRGAGCGDAHRSNRPDRRGRRSHGGRAQARGISASQCGMAPPSQAASSRAGSSGAAGSCNAFQQLPCGRRPTGRGGGMRDGRRQRRRGRHRLRRHRCQHDHRHRRICSGHGLRVPWLCWRSHRRGPGTSLHDHDDQSRCACNFSRSVRRLGQRCRWRGSLQRICHEQLHRHQPWRCRPHGQPMRRLG